MYSFVIIDFEIYLKLSFCLYALIWKCRKLFKVHQLLKSTTDCGFETNIEPERGVRWWFIVLIHLTTLNSFCCCIQSWQNPVISTSRTSSHLLALQLALKHELWIGNKNSKLMNLFILNKTKTIWRHIVTWHNIYCLGKCQNANHMIMMHNSWFIEIIPARKIICARAKVHQLRILMVPPEKR